MSCVHNTVCTQLPCPPRKLGVELTANQLAGYQQIARSPGLSDRRDVYLRHAGDPKCYFLGKV